MSKRGFSLLVLCAVLLVTAGFAATKKSQRNLEASADWSELSLQSGSLLDNGSIRNGSLLDAESDVSGGDGGNLTLLNGGGPLGLRSTPLPRQHPRQLEGRDWQLERGGELEHRK